MRNSSIMHRSSRAADRALMALIVHSPRRDYTSASQHVAGRPANYPCKCCLLARQTGRRFVASAIRFDKGNMLANKNAAAALAALFAVISAPMAGAQELPPDAAPWTAQCTGANRNAELACSMQQRVVLSTTGQLLVDVSVHIAPDTKVPRVLLQVPFGLYLPAGLQLKVGDEVAQTVALETCDATGCYGSAVLPAELIERLRQAPEMSVVFEDLAHQSVAVPVSLLGFSAAHDQIR